MHHHKRINEQVALVGIGTTNIIRRAVTALSIKKMTEIFVQRPTIQDIWKKVLHH